MADDSVTIPLAGYKEQQSARVPAGRYRVLVEDAELETSKQRNQMIKVWLKIQDAGEEQGKTLIDRLVLTEKSMFRVVNFLDSIGIPTPRKDFNIRLAQIKRKLADVDVEDGEPYQGRVKSEVRGYNRIRGPVRSESDLPSEEETGSEDLPSAPDDASELDGLGDAPSETASSAPVATDAPSEDTPGEVDQDVDLDQIQL